MSCNVMKMIDDHDSFVTFHLVHVDKCFVNNRYPNKVKMRNNKVHGLLKSDKLYTELRYEHRNGCTLLHT